MARGNPPGTEVNVSRVIPIQEVCDSIVTRIKAATFSPALKLVTIDEEWSIPATVDKLLERLPCVIVTLSGVAIDRVPGVEVAEQTLQFSLNHLSQIPSAGSKRTNVFAAASQLASLFSSAETFDDLALSTAELEECVATNITTSAELMDRNIAWAIVQVSVKVNN